MNTKSFIDTKLSTVKSEVSSLDYALTCIVDTSNSFYARGYTEVLYVIPDTVDRLSLGLPEAQTVHYGEDSLNLARIRGRSLQGAVLLEGPIAEDNDRIRIALRNTLLTKSGVLHIFTVKP